MVVVPVIVVMIVVVVVVVPMIVIVVPMLFVAGGELLDGHVGDREGAGDGA